MKVGYFLSARRLPEDQGVAAAAAAAQQRLLADWSPRLQPSVNTCAHAETTHTGTSERLKSPARRSHLKQFSVFIHRYTLSVGRPNSGSGPRSLSRWGSRSRSFVARVGTKDAARRVTLAARRPLRLLGSHAALAVKLACTRRGTTTVPGFAPRAICLHRRRAFHSGF